MLSDGSLQSSATYLHALLSIPDSAQFRVLVTCELDENLRTGVERELSVMFVDCECTNVDKRLVALVWDDAMVDGGRLAQRLQHVVRVRGVRMGASNPFDNLSAACHYLAHAVSAVDADAEESDLVFFREVALNQLMRYDNDETRWFARHPAAIVLEDADRESGSELCKTLKLYLMCNCSLTTAARKLFVHKNTVAYRIGRVREMDLFDFDDDEERLYVLLSLLISDVLTT